MDDIKARLEKEATEPYTKSIMAGLLEICEKDKKFEKVLHDSMRKLSECFSYVKSQAKKQAKNGCAMVRNDIVYGWAKDFYTMSEDKYKKLGKLDKKKEEPKKESNVVKMPKSKEQLKAPDRDLAIKKKQEKKQKYDDQLHGQMNILDFLG